jgi:HD-GYP domain-containing protein (c-di-GMP phosphodiesterase class II)
MKAGVIGVIELMNRKENFYGQRDEEIIAYLADQAAISFTRARFYEDQKNYEIHITDILLDAIDHHIPEKTGHSKRVATYSNIIAKAIHMSEEERKRLYFACLLHDVGFLKIKAEDSVKREYFLRHPVIGYDMISQINFYADIAPFILHHHERYDGIGYPAKLKGEAIPLEARIIAIADAFDVMVSTTSYKVSFTFDSAVEELKRNAGTQFDFWLVEVFVNNITPEHLE